MHKSLFIIILAVSLLLLLGSCVKPASLNEEFTSAVKTDTKSAKDDSEQKGELESSKEKNQDADSSQDDADASNDDEKDSETTKDQEDKDDGELKAKDLLNPKNNIAKVKTLGESSEIDATFFGNNKVFTVPYTDIDAITFDIAKEFGVTLNEVRIVLEVDGNAYLRPSEKEVLEEETLGQESVFNSTDEDNPWKDLEYTFFRDEDEEGYIRAIGCDIESKVIKYQIHNFKDEVTKRYRIVKPKVKNPLTTYFNNKRLIDSFCDGVLDIEPNQTIDCYHSNVDFVRAAQQGSIYEEIKLNEDFRDELFVTQPGYNERFTFLCPAAGDLDDSEDTNSTA